MLVGGATVVVSWCRLDTRLRRGGIMRRGGD
jgi:hypothetical protein